jgi:hypothetical protein
MENLTVVASRIKALEKRVDAIEEAVAIRIDGTITDAANMDTEDLQPKLARKKPEK